MTTERQQPRTDPTGRGAPWLGRAWLAVALIPLSFIPALGLSYLLYNLFGYQPENNDAPGWVDLVCTIPAVAVFLAPCVAGVFYGARTNSGGDRRGLVPLVIAGLAGLWWTVTSIVGFLG